MTEEQKASKVPLLRTAGGMVVSIGCTVGGFLLIFRGAPTSAWATAFLIGLVAATIIEPTMLADWILRRGSKQ